MQNGLYASFSPKPLKNQSGNGMHINISIKSLMGKKDSDAFMAGILKYIREISAYLKSNRESYLRLGEKRHPNILPGLLKIVPN